MPVRRSLHIAIIRALFASVLVLAALFGGVSAALAQTPTSVTLTPTASTITVWDSVTFKVASSDGTMLPLTGAAGLAAGSSHTCAVMAGGTVECWGSNGQRNALGARTALGYSSWPVVVTGLSGAVALGAGPASSTTCALDGDGGVWCWGTLNPLFYFSQTPGQVTLSRPATDVRVGWGRACALLADTTVECWTSDPRATVPPAIKKAEPVKDESGNTLSGVESITAGYFQTCALLSDGTVQCWGSNTYGELGNGTTTTSTTAVTVSGLEGPATAITAGAYHTCALMADGSVRCWGQNQYYQLGNASDDQVRAVFLLHHAGRGERAVARRGSDRPVGCGRERRHRSHLRPDGRWRCEVLGPQLEWSTRWREHRAVFGR